ncbi:MAG: PadR family transcriptional regulator [Actinomycetota bacterium]
MSQDQGDTPGSGPGGPHGFGGRRGRGRRGPSGGQRANRGDARAAILALLAEEPMHGYQVMDELAERTKGAWRPSPGSIYPTLRRLSDEGLVSSTEQDGRRVFQLTDAGRKAAEEAADGAPPWERLAPSAGDIDLRKTVFSVGAAAKQVASTGSPEQVAQAEAILTEARKRLYRLLAE